MWLSVSVQQQAFDLGAEEQALRQHAGDAGALVVFQGMVRAHDQAHPLAAGNRINNSVRATRRRRVKKDMITSAVK